MSTRFDGMAVAIDDLHLQRGEHAVLRGVSLAVPTGSVWALVGASGAGKSTILRCIVALERFDRGRIALGPHTLVPGAVPPESRLREVRRQVGLVFQHHALFTHLTVRENVMLAPMHTLGVAPTTAATMADTLLRALGVAHRADATPGQISGGEAQRVAIARALAMDPPLLLLDEPTAALDPARRGALVDTLRGLAAQGRTLLLTTHDVEFAHAVADTVAVLDYGSIVDSGPPGLVLPRYLDRLSA